MDRRTFLTTAAASKMILGANERVRGAVIGSGGRGRLLTGEFKEIGVEMAAVCDVYEPNLQAGLQIASTGSKGYSDYRRMLEDKSIDVVVVSTPDHWHAQMSIDAVEAGKDVYVEKPMAHTIDEGFRMIDAVRRTKRVLQVGTQRRSFDLFIEARRLMHESDIGEVRLVNGWWYNHQKSLRAAELKGKLDWKQWLGTAPPKSLNPVHFFNWYYFYDYSGGLMIGQAAHVVDAIHWLMNSTYPTAVTTSGGRVNLEGAEIPETTCMTMEYPENYLAVFTVGYKAMKYAGVNDQMKQFNGSKARFDVGRESYALYREDPKALDMKPVIEKRLPGAFNAATRMHIRNFLECVQSRKDPNANVEAGQYTNVVLCMAIESLRTGRRMVYDAAARKMKV